MENLLIIYMIKTCVKTGLEEDNEQHVVDLDVYLVPWMSFDLRELELSVVRVHALDFFPSRRSQNLHYIKTIDIKNLSLE